MKIPKRKVLNPKPAAAPVISPPPPQSDVLRLHVEDAGRGTAAVTARLGGEPLHVDTFNLSRAKDRDRFAAAVADLCPALETADVAAELLRARDRLTAPADAPGGGGEGRSGGSGANDGAEPPELAPGSVVRPDGFVTPGAAGFVVPRVLEGRDGPEGRNTLHVQTADGTREVRELTAGGPAAGRIVLPGGDTLYLDPVPPVPSVADANRRPGWSRRGREAWRDGAEPPCPAEVLGRVRDRFARYLWFPPADRDGTCLTLACWTLATYLTPAFPAVPYLHVTAPFNSGKTRVFGLLGRMIYRPFVTSNLTAAALFRSLHARGGTLLLDEAERLNNPRDPAAAELAGMLLAGYKRGGRATRLEPVGDSYQPVDYEVFGFKALAGISSLPPALASRCVPVRMTRADGHAAEAGRNPDGDDWAGLRDDLFRFALAYGPAVLAAAADPPDAGLANRDRELWTPLLAVAAVADAAGFGGAADGLTGHAAATLTTATATAAPEADAILLEALHGLLLKGGDPPQAKEVRAAARKIEFDLFDKWTAKGVATRLASYGIETIKSGRGATRGRRVYADHTPATVAAAARRYGIELDGDDEAPPAPPGDVPHAPRRAASATPRARKRATGVHGARRTTSGHVSGVGGEPRADRPRKLTIRKAKPSRPGS